MILQQLPPEKRILFLKLFTSELIKASYQEEYQRQVIKSEKLRQRFIQPNMSPELAIKQTIRSSAFEPSKYQIQESELTPKLPSHKTFHRMRIGSNYPPIARTLKKPFIKKLKKIIRKQQPKLPPQAQALQQIQPQYQPKPTNFNLGKIEIFFKDPYVQLIECPGQGQNLLVKKGNLITPTRMTLNKEEIDNIINSFSQQAKIPIIGGILRAAVGNLIISAVISEIVGSRFIITKISPPAHSIKPLNQISSAIPNQKP